MKVNKMTFQFILIIFLLSNPFFVLADNFGLAVDKTAVVFDVNKGEDQKFMIKVKNTSNNKQQIMIDVVDYELNDNNELILNTETNNQSDIKAWVKAKDDFIVLLPNSSEEIFFDVKVSEDTTIGSHRGAVIFKILPDTDDAIKIQGQVGVHVLFNVKGDTQATGQINSFDIPLLATEKVEYKTEFENTGNIHYIPYGEVVLTNIFTKKEELYKYNKRFAFPGKKVNFVLKRDIPSLFGAYQAKVNFVDGEGVIRNKTDYVVGYFFPIVFIGIIGVVIWISWLWYKNQKKDLDTKTPKKQKKNTKKIKESVQKKETVAKDQNKIKDNININKDNIGDVSVDEKLTNKNTENNESDEKHQINVEIKE